MFAYSIIQQVNRTLCQFNYEQCGTSLLHTCGMVYETFNEIGAAGTTPSRSAMFGSGSALRLGLYATRGKFKAPRKLIILLLQLLKNG